MPVEDLKVGDRLVTHGEGKRPIRWIGNRAYEGRFAVGNKTVPPVRISACALVPAYALINGT